METNMQTTIIIGYTGFSVSGLDGMEKNMETAILGYRFSG